MKNFLINIEKSHLDDLDEVIGVSDFPFIINTDPTKYHHKHACRSEKCTLGNLIADSMREIGNGDIAIKNAGSIRTDLQKGNITFKDILNVLPYSSEIVVKEVLGKDILDALEFGVRFLPDKSPKFPQVSGIKFHVNIYHKSSVQVDDHDTFINVNGSRRVSNIKVNGKKLNLEKKYKIVLDNFVSNGGDGFSMFSKYEDYTTTSNVDNEVLMKYIKNNLGKVIPKNYAQTEGRINIYSNPSNIEDEDADNEDEETQKQKNDKKFKVSLITYVSLGISILFIIIIVIVIFLLRNKKEISSDFSTSLVQDRLY
jgi:2',3'-cyclic-nucleotide 2'-phosphodiesterase (5'-nucleotidase family)